MATRKTTAKPATEPEANATITADAEDFKATGAAIEKASRKGALASAKKTVEAKPSELSGLKKGVDYYINLRNRFAEGGYETYEELLAAEAE